MNLMSILDPLIGPSRPTLKTCMGIYISLDTIFISETVTDSKGAVRVAHLVKVPVAAQDKSAYASRTAALNVDFFSSGAWCEAIRQALQKIRWDSKHVVVTLSSQFGITRHFVMPRIERRFWKQSIPLEAKKYIPVPLEDVVYDFLIYPLAPETGKGRMGVLFGVTHKDILESVKTGLEKLGLNLMALEVSACSAERLWLLTGKNGAKTGIFAHFDPAGAFMVFSNEGYPILYREIYIGDSQMTERRRLDMKGSLDFIGKQLGTPPYKTVTASGEMLDFWKPIIEAESSLPVETWNPAQHLGIKSTEWGGICALGASFSFQSANPLELDFSGQAKASSEGRQALLYIWGLALGLCGFILILALFQQVRLIALSGELDRLRVQTGEVSEFEGKTAEDIQKIVQTLGKKADTISAVVGDTDILTPKLAVIADIIPDYVWLVGLEYKNPLVTSVVAPSEKSLELKGHVFAEGAGEVAGAEEFKQILQKNKEFSRAFGPPRGEISVMFDVVTKIVAVDKKKTLFTIVCKSAKKNA